MPIRTPRGGGRWPRDVASTAEPGRAVLGGRASGAGPSPEWMVRHTLTPGDLRDLQVETIKSNVDLEDSSILMNISWILRADASIRLLKATKICVMGKSHFQSYSCIRCNYTQAFQTQTRPSGGKWTFSYIGFPVELNTVYFIGAHNIPNANMNEDGPSMAVNFTSPGCLDHVMKYKKKCIEAGSLWKPNITACKRSANMVEVNFTTSPLGDRYMALIQSTAVIGTSYVSEKELTRTSVVVHVTGESEGAVVQLTPYFHTCGNDCIRQRGTVVQCPQTGVSSPQDHERIKKTSFSTTTLLPSIKVLVVYPSEICFHHTVCYFTEFLQNRCRSEVILEKWQKKKIAEMGPVQWLTTQKQAADKVIFLLSNDSTTCDGNCDKKGGPCENSQDLFHLAFNLFCSDLRSQAHLHKYVVVYFREGDITDSYRALSVCPTYRLTKDATGFCAELLRAKQRVSVGRRPRACRYSCCSL
ncbi:interleukin-17 receptor B isoform X4 [Bubalus kerabau]|uniref:interleukin-17 receptor B isoform X4 n=1 Tax=Bubalus carabanensis TaxID=3119969 RepID=UPI00244EEB28|nr:interleukin-17 receptor B isoform X4 [Bubalus carabanensis]